MIAASQLATGADPLLLPPRETPYILQDVSQKIVYGCREELILDLRDSFLRFQVDIDTDSISSEFRPTPFGSKRGYVSICDSDPWNKHLKKTCGWTWLGVNQQGYLDSVLLSFNGIEPVILLQAVASSIEIFVIKPARPIVPAKKSKAGHTNTKNKR